MASRWVWAAASLLSLLAPLVALAEPVVRPNDLLLATTHFCGNSCEPPSFPVVRAVDPETGASRVVLADSFGGDFNSIGAGRDGSVAALGVPSGIVWYYDASGARVGGIPPMPVSALETHGDILVGLVRYRVRFGTFQNFVPNPPDGREVRTGPAGEIFVLVADGSVEQVDATDGQRTPVAPAGFADAIAVEPSGDVVGLSGDDVVRVAVATGDTSLVAEDVAPAGALIAVVGDGTIFLGVGESSPGVADGYLIRIDPDTGAPSSQSVDFQIRGVRALLGVLCDGVAGQCAAPAECTTADDCSDGLFCTNESCDAGVCKPAPAPCAGGFCDEDADVCLECLEPSDCEDGLFCNGAESCAEGACESGTPPCAGGQVCDESADACRPPTDVDLRKLDAPARVRLSKGKPAIVKLKARNAQTSTGFVTVHLLAVQNGITLFDQSSEVYTGRAGDAYSWETNLQPPATGTLLWTATIDDEDPDVDLQTRAVQVVP